MVRKLGAEFLGTALLVGGAVAAAVHLLLSPPTEPGTA